MPRRTLVSDRILEENGVLGEVTIGECPLFLIPVEPDLLSLELEDSFSDLYLVGLPHRLISIGPDFLCSVKTHRLYSLLRHP